MNDEPNVIVLEREGGFIIAWKTIMRADDGTPTYAYSPNAIVFPTREQAEAIAAGLEAYYAADPP
jgi:hypothetical protein